MLVFLVFYRSLKKKVILLKEKHKRIDNLMNIHILKIGKPIEERTMMSVYLLVEFFYSLTEKNIE